LATSSHNADGERLEMVDTGPLVSVVIPHLNQPDGLRRCLTALASQRNAPEFEVIVVDNGSDVIPDAITADFPFARLTAESTPGPGPARNTGVACSRGNILAFIDADCIATSGWLDIIATYLETHAEVDVIGGDVTIASVDPNRMTGLEAYESIWGYRFRMYVERDGFVGTGNMAVRRELFDRVGGFAGISVAEDVDWSHRARAKGAHLAYVHDMRIATPARKTQAELRRKWDRHIGHNYAAVRGPKDRIRWTAKALALAVSPLFEGPRIFISGRVSGLGARMRGFACLAQIRLYRARRMLNLLLRGGATELAGRWRQG